MSGGHVNLLAAAAIVLHTRWIDPCHRCYRVPKADLLAPLQNKPNPVNVVMVSATMTKPIKRLISTTLPDARMLETTATLHRAVPGSRHRFVTLTPGADKLQQLEEVRKPVLQDTAVPNTWLQSILGRLVMQATASAGSRRGTLISPAPNYANAPACFEVAPKLRECPARVYGTRPSGHAYCRQHYKL